MIRSPDHPPQKAPPPEQRAPSARAESPPGGTASNQQEAAPEQILETARGGVRAKLHHDREQLLALKAKLEGDLESGNCIKLDLLVRDFEEELTRLTAAIEELNERKTQRAINLLEEEACRNIQTADRGIVDLKAENRREFLQHQSQIDKISKLQVSKDQEALSLPEDEDSLTSEWDRLQRQIISAELQQMYPDWFLENGLPNLQNEAISRAVRAESDRLKRLCDLRSPVELANWAISKTQDSRDHQIAIRFAEQYAEQRMIARDAELDGLKRGYTNANASLDQLIQNIGGRPKTKTERNNIKLPENRRLLSPEELYTRTLQDAGGDPNRAEQQIAATYRKLTDERQDIAIAMASAERLKHHKAIMALKRRRMRNSMLLYQVQAAFQFHNRIEQKYTSLALLAEQQRQQELFQASPAVRPEHPTPEASALPAENEVVLYLADKKLIDTSHGAWRAANARIVEQAFLRTFQTSGIEIPCTPSDVINGMPSSVYPEDIKGQPIVWFEHMRLTNVNGVWQDQAHAIHDYEHLMRVFESYKQLNPDQHPMHRIRVNMREDTAQQLTTEGLRRNPAVLQKIARDLLRYMPPGSEAKLAGMKFVLS